MNSDDLYLRLGVNIDHVATIRNTRGGVHPDPLKAAQIASKPEQMESLLILEKTEGILVIWIYHV